MRRMMLAAVLGLAVVVAVRADDDPEPKPSDVGKLAGAWELSEIKVKGIAMPLPPDAPKMTFTFKKNGTFSATGMGENKDGKWKISPRKSPKELEFTDGQMKTPMIYKLDKDVLTVAASDQPNGPRPKDFASAAATMVFKRKKAK